MPEAGAQWKMAAVGDYESVLPFQAVGVEPHTADNDLRKTLLDLARKNYAVVFLVDSLYKQNMAIVEEINEQYSVSIIPIPGLEGSTGIGVRTIRDSVERAVGMDIFEVS